MLEELKKDLKTVKNLGIFLYCIIDYGNTYQEFIDGIFSGEYSLYESSDNIQTILNIIGLEGPDDNPINIENFNKFVSKYKDIINDVNVVDTRYISNSTTQTTLSISDEFITISYEHDSYGSLAYINNVYMSKPIDRIITDYVKL